MINLTLDDAYEMPVNPIMGHKLNSGDVIGPEMYKFGVRVGQAYYYKMEPNSIWTIVGFTDDLFAVTCPLHPGIYSAAPNDTSKHYIS